MAEAQGLARREAVAAGLPKLARACESPLAGACVEPELPGFHAARGRPRRPRETVRRAGASLTGT